MLTYTIYSETFTPDQSDDEVYETTGEVHQETTTGTLSELLSDIQWLDINSCEGADWFYSIEPSHDHDYFTKGIEVTYSLHLDSQSMRHFDRVARFIC